MGMIILTGSERTTTGLVAAATASATAAGGRTTLLAGLGPTHVIGGLLNCTTSPQPQQVAPNLDVWLADSLDVLGAVWEERRKAIGGAAASISGDELPTVPGSDLFIALHLLRKYMATYNVVVLDAGDYGTLLRSLSFPDSFRWGLRLLLGLDRGPGRSTQSQARALVPTALLPFEWLGQVQEARVEVEALRDSAAHTGGTTVGVVLAPDGPSLREAQFAVPALQLHGLSVAALFVGALLPAENNDARLVPVIAAQQSILAQAREQWSPHALLPLPFVPPTSEGVQILGRELYQATTPEQVFSADPPISVSPGPGLSLHLPLLPRGALRLTVSGDELIVRVGPYRRHMLLPDGLRGVSAIKATRSGDYVLIGRRE